MGYVFNVDEIFEMACRIERNGARFYRNMANDISDPDIHKLMLNFASMEVGHERVFLSMKKRLSDQDRGKTIYDPDEETIIEFFQKIRNNEEYKDIKGIAYVNEDNELFYTDKRVPINLDIYPPFPVKYNKFGAIEITRGCSYLCYFCQTPYIAGTTPRHRSIESICKYVQIMNDKNLTDIRFITPNAFSYGSKDGKSLSLEKLEELWSVQYFSLDH